MDELFCGKRSAHEPHEYMRGSLIRRRCPGYEWLDPIAAARIAAIEECARVAELFGARSIAGYILLLKTSELSEISSSMRARNSQD